MSLFLFLLILFLWDSSSERSFQVEKYLDKDSFSFLVELESPDVLVKEFPDMYLYFPDDIDWEHPVYFFKQSGEFHILYISHKSPQPLLHDGYQYLNITSGSTDFVFPKESLLGDRTFTNLFYEFAEDSSLKIVIWDNSFLSLDNSAYDISSEIHNLLPALSLDLPLSLGLLQDDQDDSFQLLYRSYDSSVVYTQALRDFYNSSVTSRLDRVVYPGSILHLSMEEFADIYKRYRDQIITDTPSVWALK
ncbi:MAG: hypothetical protein U9Q15_00970 [Patescibacteria group bacterium]|nr:hypothetical protein [Patescibacteria group bacterium]